MLPWPRVPTTLSPTSLAELWRAKPPCRRFSVHPKDSFQQSRCNNAPAGFGPSSQRPATTNLSFTRLDRLSLEPSSKQQKSASQQPSQLTETTPCEALANVCSSRNEGRESYHPLHGMLASLPQFLGWSVSTLSCQKGPCFGRYGSCALRWGI